MVSRYAPAAMKLIAPALFLLERFILRPAALASAAFGAWALLIRHWYSGAFLLLACTGMALIARGLKRRETQLRRAVPAARPFQSLDEDNLDEDVELDDSQDLAKAIVKSNVLLCILLAGLIWSEHLPVMRSAVFLVLFSIVYPAAVALFCLGGERVLRERASDHSAPPHLPPWHGATRPH